MTRQTSLLSRAARRGPLAPLAVLAVFAFGCGHPASGGPAADSSGSPQAPATVESQSAPRTEGGGPEQPAPAVKAPPAIKVAKLPIGGAAEVPAGGRQCVRVNMLNNAPMPAGVTVAVNDVRFENGAFSASRSGHGCSEPPCLGSFAFTPDAPACGVLITATGSSGSQDVMYLAGVVCPDRGQQATCSRYAHDAGNGQYQLTIGPPDAADPDAGSG